VRSVTPLAVTGVRPHPEDGPCATGTVVDVDRAAGRDDACRPFPEQVARNATQATVAIDRAPRLTNGVTTDQVPSVKLMTPPGPAPAKKTYP
jgi:hypothetical protein